VEPFPWSSFRVDGEQVAFQHLRLWQPFQPGPKSFPETLRLAVPVPGGKHRIDYEFRPPHTWVRLNRFSGWLLGGWFAFLTATAAWRWFARVRRRFRPDSAQRSNSCPAGDLDPSAEMRTYTLPMRVA
jgi:hypothetical protein